MKPLRILATALLTAGLSAAEKPNILLIVGEDHGVELSCYGDPVIKTPHIDRLAAGGILYRNGYVTQTVCSPSRSTIFTGLYPHSNGMLGLATHQFHYYKKWPTTYSLLKQAGYRTGFIGKIHVNPESIVSDHFDFQFQKGSNFAKKNVASYATKAGEFFREKSDPSTNSGRDKPFFMTVNYPDAHWPLQEGRVGGLPEDLADPDKVKVMPYVTAEGETTPRLQAIARNYYNCMRRLDDCVGQLLAELEKSGKADRTLVIFIGDHGAQMARGKIFMYEAGTRVPFIARWPGHIKPGQRSDALVSTVDLLPTLLTAAGAEDRIPAHVQGKAIQPTFTADDQGVSFRDHLFCERNVDGAHYAHPQRTVRDQRYKLIHTLVGGEDPGARDCLTHAKSHWSGCLHITDELPKAGEITKRGYATWLNPPEYQLYDLKEDPHEWQNIADDPGHAATLQRLKKALTNWQEETSDPLRRPALLDKLMTECREVAKSGKRSPKGGWNYLEYLHPDKLD